MRSTASPAELVGDERLRRSALASVATPMANRHLSVCGSAVRSWAARRAFQDQCVLTKLIAQFVDMKSGGHT